MFDLNSLNEMQRKAVTTLEGPVLVVAGAGSGKTRALTSRIYNLIKNHNVNPSNILAITFTNRATREMKERLQDVDNGDLQISTFHSFCARLLRQYVHNFKGYNKYFTIYGDDEKSKIIKKIIKAFDLDGEDLHKQIIQNIATAKNDGVSPHDFEDVYMYVRNLNETVRVYRAYEEELSRNNALDFDDLLSKTYLLLSNNKEVLNELQTRFKYIHIDEFQDTNKVQYKIVKLLAAAHKNLFVVGDEDQSIYAWRGASLENTNLFVKEFNPQIIKLEKNYRSTKSILDHANRLIAHNKSRIEKNLYTDSTDAHEIEYFKAYSDHDEAEHVVRRIYNLINYDRVSPNEIAILFRMGALSRLFEEKLLSYNIPYKLYGGFKFFDRLEVKNVLSYLWLIYNPNDNESVKRIINFPKRSIGKVSVDRLEALSQEVNKSIYDIVLGVESYNLPKSLTSKLLEVKDIFETINGINKTGSMVDAVQTVLSITNIRESYSQDVEEDNDRLLNIGQLENSIKEFEYANSELTLIDYLESVSLQAEDSEEEEFAETVKVSTVHAAKGLEFEAVFVVGAEENLFPISRALASEEDIEEERRLMYVAVTRSKKHLLITSSDNRYLYNSRSNMIPSRFLGEMGLVKVRKPSVSKQSGYVNFKDASFSNYNINALSATGSTKNSKKESDMPSVVHTYSETETSFSPNLKGLMSDKLKKQADKYQEFKIGAKVFHPKFGVGTVTKSSVETGDKNIAVQFEKIGTKMLNLDFAPLDIFGK